ncbi:MAG: NAD(P)-dependent oxidoreductase [Pseudomonadota bacterium]
MTRILVATEKPFAKVAVDGIRKIVEDAGFELALLEKYQEKAQLLAAVAAADALIVRSDLIDRDVVAAAKQLKIVVRAGAGYDNLDLAACSAAGIAAMNTPGQNANAVAELAIGLMIMAARNNFDGSSGTELLGRKLGVHAYGNVGRRVATVAKCLGMQVFAYDPFVPAPRIEAEGIAVLPSVSDLYASCQYVSLHVPADDKTKKSINHDLVVRMPKGATLVNTARAEIIDEEGLLRVMAERPDFKYYSDISPKHREPWQEFAARAFFTPKKMGAQTAEANINAGLAAARQIVGFIDKGDRAFLLNAQALERRPA